MKIFNSIKLVNDEEAYLINAILMFGTFTLSIIMSIPMFAVSKGNTVYILWVNGVLFFLYILANIFFKNALKVFSKELFGILIFTSVLPLSYFYYGYELIGEFKPLLVFFILYFLIDFIIFYKKNSKNIYGVVGKCIVGMQFNYAYREECRKSNQVERSFLANIVLIIFCLFLPFLLLFGKSLPYVFFGVFGGKIDIDYLLLGMFLIYSLFLFFSLTYIYLFILYLYYFLKIVYLRRHEFKNLE